jgi:hypothetical protein
MVTVSAFNDARYYCSYAEELRQTGVVVLPPFLMFNAEELDQINELQSQIEEQKVIQDHDVYVRRVLTDEEGSLPLKPNPHVSDQILAILTDFKRSTAFASLFQSDATRYLRRCQINRMLKGSFIGKHFDTDANPDYTHTAILQLGDCFKGGEFVIFPDTEKERKIPLLQRGSVLIISCTVLHCVRTVLESERKSLVWFYSNRWGPNRLPRNDSALKCDMH